jgi:hypothetical protein
MMQWECCFIDLKDLACSVLSLEVFLCESVISEWEHESKMRHGTQGVLDHEASEVTPLVFRRGLSEVLLG